MKGPENLTPEKGSTHEPVHLKLGGYLRYLNTPVDPWVQGRAQARAVL